MRILPFDYAVRNLFRSTIRLALAVSGSMLVILLLLSAGAFVRGMELSLKSTGDLDNVILLGAGSEESFERSEIPSSVAGLVPASIPGIRSTAGVDYVSVEVHVQLPIRLKAEQDKGSVVLVRGVTPAATLVHSAFRMVSGHFPRPGYDELLLGEMVETRLGLDPGAMELGRTLWIDKREWKVCGRFTSAGTVMDSEIWTAMTDLKAANKRETDSCVIVTLDRDQAEFADVALFTKMRVDLELSALPEVEYYAKLAEFFAPIRILAWVTAGLIALGGLFGGLNIMYAAFVSRVRELGTLQACGFRRFAILLSLIQESVLSTSIGALMACAVAVLLLDGLAVRFSLGVFGLRVDPFVIAIGLTTGLLLGVAGAVPPAWRCLRMDIPAALKAM